MIKKKVILFLLVFTMSLYIGHDLLPYHNHGMSHFISSHAEEEVIESFDEEAHHCDGHGLCVTCFTKEQTKIHINHLEIDFSINHTDLILKIEKIIVPPTKYSHLFKNENSHKYKTKFIRQAHSLRAPPFLV